MMEIPPSRLGSLPLVRYLRTSLVIGALSLVAGCVSQSEVLTVDTSVRQPAPQLGLTNEAQSGVIVASGEAEVLPPNVPLQAPRVANLQAPTAQTQPVPSSTSVLAAVQPEAKQAAPAQTAIDQAASTTNVGTTEVSVTAATATSDIAATAPSNTSTAGLSTSSTTAETVPANTPETQLSAPQPETQSAPKPRSTLWARLFQSNRKKPESDTSVKRPTRNVATGRGDDDGVRIASAHSTAKRPKQPISKNNASTNRTRTTSNGALPGVKSSSEIFGLSEETDTSSSNTGVTQVAAVGSLGRLSPNGIRVQHDKVQVACLKPGVLRMLKQVERKYGRKPIVTSGYRSPKRNRRAGGAKNSMHIYCKAADIQVEGVSKWQLAKYLRTLPNRGGVGTYCRTKSVHIDTGSKRDWHHPCRRSSKRKKRKT